MGDSSPEEGTDGTFEMGRRLATAILQGEGKVEEVEGLIVASFSPTLREEAIQLLDELRMALCEMFVMTVAIAALGEVSRTDEDEAIDSPLCPACEPVHRLRIMRISERIARVAEDVATRKSVASGRQVVHHVVERIEARRVEVA